MIFYNTKIDVKILNKNPLLRSFISNIYLHITNETPKTINENVLKILENKKFNLKNLDGNIKNTYYHIDHNEN